jgi:hypothetical protein
MHRNPVKRGLLMVDLQPLGDRSKRNDRDRVAMDGFIRKHGMMKTHVSKARHGAPALVRD